ncbi:MULTISPECIES: TadE/TadG family type IV pilus assembly protein [Novosphingobium]|nr:MULTISPECIES: TadE/TadG family type IV pilus assembly protein [Novosphingobium]CDO38258.1 putative TadE-like protein [Novosphingobium sp. KN65.2]
MSGVHAILRNQSGAAAAEMALILPLVLLLIFGTFEGAYYIMCEHRVVKGVRDAARYAGRLPFSQYDCAGTFGGDATAVKNLARTGQISGGTAAVYGWANADVTIAVDCSSSQQGIYASVGGNAPRVKISADVAYPSLFGTLGLVTTGWRLKASAQSPVMGL